MATQVIAWIPERFIADVDACHAPESVKKLARQLCEVLTTNDETWDNMRRFDAIDIIQQVADLWPCSDKYWKE